MDAQLYFDLREKVRDQVRLDVKHRDLMRRFIVGLERYVNREMGREKQVCASGRAVSGKFEKDVFDAFGSRMNFALQISFHDEKGVIIMQRAIPFTARCHGISMKVMCDETTEEISFEQNDFDSDVVRAEVARLLNDPLAKHVDEALNKASFA